MFKKLLTLSIIFILLIAINCSKSRKYEDMKNLFRDIIKAQEHYISDIEKVENVKDAANAINRLAEQMEKFIPKMKELEKKYPELKNQKEPPVELRDIIAKMAEVGSKMGEASMHKMVEYATKPEVQKAAKRLGESMR